MDGLGLVYARGNYVGVKVWTRTVCVEGEVTVKLFTVMISTLFYQHHFLTQLKYPSLTPPVQTSLLDIYTPRSSWKKSGNIGEKKSHFKIFSSLRCFTSTSTWCNYRCEAVRSPDVRKVNSVYLSYNVFSIFTPAVFFIHWFEYGRKKIILRGSGWKGKELT